MPRITSAQNPRIKAAVRLRDRQGRNDQRRIIIDGVREIARAAAAGVELTEMFVCWELCRDPQHEQLVKQAEAGGAEVIEVSSQVMEKLAFGNRTEGVVAVARPPQRSLADLQVPEQAVVAVVEGVEKPGNLGAILRTADAAGVAVLIVVDGGTDLFNPNAIRSSLGAVFTVPLCAATSDEALAWLCSQQFQLIAARVDAALEYTAANFRGRVAIILGSEAHGLTDRWRAADITPVRLPIVGSVDSLNLSVTAAVLFYEALRQRSGS